MAEQFVCQAMNYFSSYLELIVGINESLDFFDGVDDEHVNKILAGTV